MTFRIIERTFSEKENCPTILIANIHTSTDVEQNILKIEQIIEIAHQKGVNIVVLPELCVTGYIWDTDDHEDITSLLEEGENDRIHSRLRNIRDSLSGGGKGLEYIFYNNVRKKNGAFYNSTFILNAIIDFNDEDYIYDKVFLPAIEQRYFQPGTDKRLAINTKWGRFGFLICYDLCFVELPRKYAFIDGVNSIITMANWRSEAIREYALLNVRTDHYYGFLWDLMNSSKAAYNQVWSIGANTVGHHDISGNYFWGGSGIWPPSGLKLLQASNIKEELLVIHNVNIKEQREKEIDKFNYRIDFEKFYSQI